MAATFDWTSAGAGLDGTLRIHAGDGDTDYPLTVATKADTRICLAAQRGDEAAEAAVAESIEDMREDDETASLFH